MKSKIILGVISLLLVFPLTGQALTFDNALMSYITTLKTRIHTLEVENAKLKENQCVGTKIITKRKAVKKEEFAQVSFSEPRIQEDGYDIDVNLTGDFDTAYFIAVSPSGTQIATLNFTKATKFDLNVGKGTYTYNITAMKDGKKSVLTGTFAI